MNLEEVCWTPVGIFWCLVCYSQMGMKLVSDCSFKSFFFDNSYSVFFFVFRGIHDVAARGLIWSPVRDRGCNVHKALRPNHIHSSNNNNKTVLLPFPPPSGGQCIHFILLPANRTALHPYQNGELWKTLWFWVESILEPERPANHLTIGGVEALFRISTPTGTSISFRERRVRHRALHL